MDMDQAIIKILSCGCIISADRTTCCHTHHMLKTMGGQLSEEDLVSLERRVTNGIPKWEQETFIDEIVPRLIKALREARGEK